MGDEKPKDQSRISADRRAKPTLMLTILCPNKVVYNVFSNLAQTIQMFHYL